MTVRRREFAAARFSEQSRNFDGTVLFLKAIGWIREEGDDLALTLDGHAACKASNDDEEIRKRLAESISSAASPYQTSLAGYLLRFKRTDSHLAYRPPIPDRLEESTLRNFLMDMRVVTYRAGDDMYELSETGVDLYLWAKNCHNHLSRSKLETACHQKEELGAAAELAALAYEKKRVGVQWEQKVEHISAKIPFACYDIKSVTLGDGEAAARYIEVKAVPSDSHQFYWTASELESAQLLRNRYFLYLLPVGAGCVFDIAQMLIVEDPFMTVYRNPQKWLVEENVVLCKRKA